MKLSDHKEILFSNFNYNPNIFYFFYIGDLKGYGLNIFLQEALEDKFEGKEVQFVAIIPDILSQYNYKNVIAINPVVQNYREAQQNHEISCRINSSIFMTAVSESPGVHQLIKKILANQKTLFINMYESVMELTLDELDGVVILGPDKNLAIKFNSKTTQYKLFSDIVPMADFCLCDSTSSLLEITESLRLDWSDGIFISCEYSAAGSNSTITTNQQHVIHWSQGKGGLFLMTRFIPHTLDPTVLAVVANEHDVYVAGVADQKIKGGNRFVGSTYPSVVTDKQRKKLHDYTVLVGQAMGKEGYRGIFGCDYIITDEGDIIFIEVNARKQGTTLEFCYTLEQSLPEGSPTLPELEYYAVVENRFPSSSVEMDSNQKNIHWGTRNFKLDQAKTTSGYIPQNSYEREAFQKVAQGELLKDFVVLEHIGTNITVMPGTFLARTVSVATNQHDMEEGLRQGIQFIKQTINEV